MESLYTFAVAYGHVALVVALVWLLVNVSLEMRDIPSKVLDAIKTGAFWPYFVAYEGFVMLVLNRPNTKASA